MPREPNGGVVRAQRAGRPGTDPDAIAALMERHGASVMRLCRNRTRSAADAEDAYQETFLRALLHLSRFRFQGSFTSWLFRIAENACRDIARRRMRRPAIPMETVSTPSGMGPNTWPGSMPEPAELALESEEARRVRLAIERLPLPLRMTLRLRFEEGLAYTEAAHEMGVAEGTVKSRQHRALAALAELLPDEVEAS